MWGWWGWGEENQQNDDEENKKKHSSLTQLVKNLASAPRPTTGSSLGGIWREGGACVREGWEGPTPAQKLLPARRATRAM